MNNELLNTLRYKSEGTDLDFKQAQYRFIGGSEEEKSELLKDILALANAWRDGTGYIVLGFRDRSPHPADVVGITGHIDDAQLQQFVNSKVKPKLTFRYEECIYEGKTVGIISVPKQARPFYLSNSYGKLKSNVVYVRRGSSTDEAEPPEACSMMGTDAGRGNLSVALSVLNPANDELPESFELRYLKIPTKLPNYESGRNGFGLGSVWRDNSRYWKELAEYIRVESSLINIQFVLTNHSSIELSNAKLEVRVNALDGQEFEMRPGTDLPNEPESQYSTLTMSLPDPVNFRDQQLTVDDGGKTTVCHVRFGSLLPSEERRASDTLALIPLGPGKLCLQFRILAAELSSPIEIERIVNTTGTVESPDLDRIQELSRDLWKQSANGK